MIRTKPEPLTTIEGQAYKNTLPSGGIGLTILREDTKETGVAFISQYDGAAVPALNVYMDPNLFPQKAFDEALKLTADKPFRSYQTFKLYHHSMQEKSREEMRGGRNESKHVEDFYEVLNSQLYKSFLDYYTDSDDHLLYDAINRDMISAAHNSNTVKKAIADKRSVKAIRHYVMRKITRRWLVKERTYLNENELIERMIEVLNAAKPGRVFQQFDEDIRSWRGRR